MLDLRQITCRVGEEGANAIDTVSDEVLESARLGADHRAFPRHSLCKTWVSQWGEIKFSRDCWKQTRNTSFLLPG